MDNLKKELEEFDKKFTNPATTQMRAMDLNGEPYPMASCKEIKAFFLSSLTKVQQQAIEEFLSSTASQERDEVIRDLAREEAYKSKEFTDVIELEKKKAGEGMKDKILWLTKKGWHGNGLVELIKKL